MKIIKLFAASAAALGFLASCQLQEAVNLNDREELVPASLTASFNTVETKVSYTETTTDGIKLQPAWTVGDTVIGFDEATPTNNTYTFTVSDVAADGTAKLEGTCPAICTLHLIYFCGAPAASITEGAMAVGYDNQAGTGNSENVYAMPAVMLADGEVFYGSGDFHFSNAGAVIGVKAVKGVPSGSTISKVTVSGEDLSAATIALDGSSKLALTATEKADDSITTATLDGVTVADDAGTLSELVLIAVPADAKVGKVTAVVGGVTYSFKLANAATLAAGKYSYIKGETFTKDQVIVSVVANPSGSASFKIDGEAETSKEVIRGADVTLKAEPTSDDYFFLKWSDGETDLERTVTVTEDVEYTAVFSYRITANIPLGYVYGTSSVEYLDANKAKLTAIAPAETSFVGWVKEGGDGTILSTETIYETVPSEITPETNFIPVFKSVETSKYVDIVTGLNDDKTVKAHTKWAKQNLSISTSGSRSWKGGNTSAVKVPGTEEDVKNGDYFQWAAYAGYYGSASGSDKGLLIYSKFTSEGCGDSSDAFTFKTSGKNFTSDNAPYASGSSYSEYTSGNVNLVPSDDVANIILSGSWRMPTYAEFKAVIYATYWAWDTKDKGYYVFSPGYGTSGAANGRGTLSTTTDDKKKALLFFPASGSGRNDRFYDVGVAGSYWTSSLISTKTEYAFDVDILSYVINHNNGYYRYTGRSVRPVSD